MKTRIASLTRAAVVAAVCGLPSVALACPLCLGSMSEANRLAFLGTMVLLTSMPVIMIGSLIFWIARRASAADDEQAALDANATERQDALRQVEKADQA